MSHDIDDALNALRKRFVNALTIASEAVSVIGDLLDFTEHRADCPAHPIDKHVSDDGCTCGLAEIHQQANKIREVTR